jgi:transglutaminase-like putative cysteine protease
VEEEHQKATASRLVLLIALVGLSVVGAASFARVFRGSSAGLRLMLAAAAAVLLGGLLERRNVVLATLASAAGLALMVGWLVFPETTKYLLPTPTTYRATLHAWKVVGRIADQQVAPTPPLDPLFLAGLTAVWTASFASHVLAVRARSPLLSLVPPGALLAFTSLVLLSNGPRPLYVAAFLAAAMAVLFGDSLRRVGQWGPLTMWHGRRRLGSATTLRGARRIALACLGVALFLPGLLPGYRGTGLIDVHSKHSLGRISIDPLVDIKPALVQAPAVELFTVHSSQLTGAYWRLIALDRFDGRRWTASNPDAFGGLQLRQGTLQPSSPSGPLDTPTVALRQQIRIERLGGQWLPVAYNPVGLTSNKIAVRFDPASSTLVAPDGSPPGYSYDVTSSLPEPTRDELDTVTNTPSPSLARYVDLPADMPRQIYEIAHQLTDDQPTMFGKVFAIQEYLHTFRYDLHVQPGRDVNHLLYFLTQSKAGYCEQFAGSMAVLLRALGIPARVAVGFTRGTYDSEQGLWHVTTQNAHSWVEVFFQGKGWLAFEPTPTRYNPVAQAYLAPVITGGGGLGEPICQRRIGFGDPEAACTPGGTKTTPTQGATQPPASPPRTVREVPGTGAIGKPHGWQWWAVRFGLLAVVLLLAAIPLVKLARRRVALAAASEPRERVLAAYRLMADQAADLGLGRLSHETLWEYRRRLRNEVTFSDGHLDRLTNLVSLAAYSEAALSNSQADQAVEAARVAARDIARSGGTSKRIAGWFRIELPRR